MDAKILKQAKALSRDVLYWSTVLPGHMTKHGITEFSFLAEIVVPRADALQKLIKIYEKKSVVVRRTTSTKPVRKSKGNN